MQELTIYLPEHFRKKRTGGYTTNDYHCDVAELIRHYCLRVHSIRSQEHCGCTLIFASREDIVHARLRLPDEILEKKFDRPLVWKVIAHKNISEVS